jgi:isocitrate lyase
MKTTETRIQELVTDWITNPRWNGIERPYTAEEVVKLQGSYQIEHSVARIGANTLWSKLNSQDFVAGLGALTGNQAIQEVEAGLDAIYLSGWQVAADANVAGKCTLTNLYILRTAFH